MTALPTPSFPDIMRSPAARFLVLLLGLGVLASSSAAPPKKTAARPAVVKPAAAEAAAAHAPAIEEDKGKDINGVCAACHGEFGQGGKRGEYPRIAGQRAAYLKDQLKSFRARKRINIPMYPYTQERELTDADIAKLRDQPLQLFLDQILSQDLRFAAFIHRNKERLGIQ